MSSFHCYVTHDEVKGNPYALALNYKTLQKIAAREPGYNYLGPQSVSQAITDFFLANRMIEKVGDSVVAAGKNFAAFDYQFLRRLMLFKVRFKHRSLDPAAYFCRAGRKEPPSLKECLEMAGIEGEVPHTAVEDALLTIRVLRAGWNRVHRLGTLAVPLGRYRHYKGCHYNVVAVSRDSEEPARQLVTYVDDGGNCWTRPLPMFLESVDGEPRFKRVS